MKGKKYNVIPYCEERLGNKLNGKEVSKIEMKDGYCVYGYDKDGRIRLVEHAVTSLKKFYDFECYDYEGEIIYKYDCSLTSSIFVSVNIFEGDQIRETYKICENDSWSHDDYIYQGDTLSRIDVCMKDIYGEMWEWQEYFYYDNKKKLKIIQCEESGYRTNFFCDRKLNYKKVEGNLEKKITESCQNIYLDSHDIIIEGIEITLDSIVENPEIRIEIIYDNKEQQLETGKCVSENAVVLREFPLDDLETEKMINSILKVIVKLWEENLLDEDVYVSVAKGGVDILEEKEKLPRWFKKNIKIYFEEGKICYKNLGNEKIPARKSIREIYMDMKKAVNRGNNLQNQIEIFEGMCKVPVDNSSYGEDVFIMTAEGILFKDKLMFGVSLVRQIPYEDEFIQVGMDIVYELDDSNKTIGETFWSDTVEGDFFQFVKGTATYELLCKKKVYDIDTFIRET